MNKSTKFLFIRSSETTKTGAIPVVYASSNTCPDSCPLKDGNGCYGESGRTKLHWDRLDAGGSGAIDVDQLCRNIAALPRKILWRYGIVGDLPGNGDLLDAAALRMIVEANGDRKGFAFSHKPVGLFSPDAVANLLAIERANKAGFTINLSADDVNEADELYDLGVGPVVVTLPTDAPAHPTRTPKGRIITVCPADRNKEIDCARCGMCANVNRKNIYGFRAHGTKRNTINRRLRSLPVIQAAA